METQATAATKPAQKTAAARKAAAAQKFSDNAAAKQMVAKPVVKGVLAADIDPPVAGGPAPKAPRTPRKTGGPSLKAAKTAATKPSAVKEEFTPVVVETNQKHTAIAFSANAKQIELIPMDSGGLFVKKLSRDRFAAEYHVIQGYPVAKAAKSYLGGTVVADPKAKAVLELLAAAEAGKPIARGELVAVMSKHDEPSDKPAKQATKVPAKQPAKTATPKAAKAPKEAKPRGHSVEGEKKLAVGKVDYKEKVRPGTHRAALMAAIVACAKRGGKVGDVLGQMVTEGKSKVSSSDVQFAVSNGYVSFAA